MLLSDQGRDHEAIESYQTALKLTPDRPDTLSNISLPLSRVVRADEALAVLERAIAINPNHLNARHRYAIQLSEAGRSTEAKHAFHAVLNILPNHADTMLGLSQLQSGKENEPLLPVIKSTLSHVPKNAPDRALLNFALGAIYWQQKDYEKTAKALNIANAQEARAPPLMQHVKPDKRKRSLICFRRRNHWLNPQIHR